MRNLPSWLLIAAAWFALGLSDATRTIFVMRAEGMHHDWPALFLVLLASWLVWGLATPLVLRLDRGKKWWFHIAGCLALSLVAAAWIALLEWLFNPWAAPETPDFATLWEARFGENLVAYCVLYALILLVNAALRSREQVARQKELLAEGRLEALRRQIEPHFLFNSLNAVVALIREGRSTDAIGVTVELSDLLRRMLDESGRPLVPLSEELEFLGKYLDIEKVRFGERLDVAIADASDLAGAEVPALLLQPLAENAIKHGIGLKVEGGRIEIAVGRDRDQLLIRVENDGPALPAEIRHGVGLSNVKARLANLYGENAKLSLGPGDPGKIRVVVSLPYREAPVR